MKITIYETQDKRLHMHLEVIAFSGAKTLSIITFISETIFSKELQNI